MVPGCHHLCDAVWVSTVLLKASQQDNSEGHEKKDHDGKL